MRPEAVFMSGSSWLVQRLQRLSTVGLLLGTLCFALSLTPSLLPRTYVVQGILSGCAFAVGYGAGVFLEWLWTFLGLRLPERCTPPVATLVVLLLCLAAAFVSLWLAPGWQNDIRTTMGMPPVESGHALQIAAIALLPAALIILLGTLLTRVLRRVAQWLARLLPPRLAFLGSLIVVGVVTTTLVNGVLVRAALRAADSFYAELDSLAGQFEAQPANPLQSGSSSSLIAWDTIGRDARVYVQSGPTAAEIERMIDRPAVMPLRVYVGLHSAPTLAERAQLALDEMLRVGAFDRSILVVIMPVGTGWVDPPAIDTLEFLHAGDVASVALQYSYLASSLSLVAEPNVGVDAARALFSAVYGHWRQLPPDARPKLYLHGLSLGAYASQESALLYDVLADPFQGALWVGPPFASRQWQSYTANRVPGTPAWLPRVGNGSTIRFTNQQNALDIPGAAWGPIRLIYLQYPSDPVVFFEPASLYRPPRWLDARAPDVSSSLIWVPAVTFLQLALDMALSQSAPVGFGHVYAPQDYLEAWAELTDPPGWDRHSLDTLERKLTRTGGVEQVLGGWFRTRTGRRSSG